MQKYAKELQSIQKYKSLLNIKKVLTLLKNIQYFGKVCKSMQKETLLQQQQKCTKAHENT